MARTTAYWVCNANARVHQHLPCRIVETPAEFCLALIGCASGGAWFLIDRVGRRRIDSGEAQTEPTTGISITFWCCQCEFTRLSLIVWPAFNPCFDLFGRPLISRNAIAWWIFAFLLVLDVLLHLGVPHLLGYLLNIATVASDLVSAPDVCLAVGARKVSRSPHVSPLR